MHAHFLPGLDDGAPDLSTAIALVKALKALGYQKLVATPHIMGDFYQNTPETIQSAFDKVKKACQDEAIDIDLAFAAEYYLDESLMERLRNETPLLTFGNQYLLFETSYINESVYFGEALFLMQSQGYKPVLAHPERYTYMYDKGIEAYQEWHERGLLFQVNLLSLNGYYSPAAKTIARKLMDKKMVQFLGTDAHAMRHIEQLKHVKEDKVLQQLLAAGQLLNPELR